MIFRLRVAVNSTSKTRMYSKLSWKGDECIHVLGSGTYTARSFYLTQAQLSHGPCLVRLGDSPEAVWRGVGVDVRVVQLGGGAVRTLERQVRGIVGDAQEGVEGLPLSFFISRHGGWGQARRGGAARGRGAGVKGKACDCWKLRRSGVPQHRRGGWGGRERRGGIGIKIQVVSNQPVPTLGPSEGRVLTF